MVSIEVRLKNREHLFRKFCCYFFVLSKNKRKNTSFHHFSEKPKSERVSDEIPVGFQFLFASV